MLVDIPVSQGLVDPGAGHHPVEVSGLSALAARTGPSFQLGSAIPVEKAKTLKQLAHGFATTPFSHLWKTVKHLVHWLMSSRWKG